MFKHSVFASIFCAVRYPNIPRECKERQIFEAFTICTEDDEEMTTMTMMKKTMVMMMMILIDRSSLVSEMMNGLEFPRYSLNR